ncbi:MAG: LysR family transcriptional regulator [Thiotrichaceae bacterium]|nr:LysR family transcriptional regulator [Thiotrichaceae bacterium]
MLKENTRPDTITLTQMRSFDVLVKTKSYTRAAKQRNLSQPAISQQIKFIVDCAGCALFDRSGRGFELTAKGKVIYKQISATLLAHDKMVALLAGMSNSYRPRLKIHAATTANHIVSHMISSYAKKNPNFIFSLSITNREDLLKQLNNLEPDLVIMGEPPTRDGVLFPTPLMENPLVMIAAADHQLAGKKSVSLEELKGFNFIVREEGSGTKAAIDKFFNKHEHSLENTLEMSSNEAIKHAVMAGLGLGIASLHTIKSELENKNVVIIRAEGFPIMRRWYLVRCKGKAWFQEAKDFHDYIVSECTTYEESYSKVCPSFTRQSK